MKLRLLAAAVAAITMTAGVAGAQDLNSEKGKLSYAFGYDFARNLADLNLPILLWDERLSTVAAERMISA